MADTFKLKRSTTSSAVPTTNQLAEGELAVNVYDGKLFLKKDNGSASIVEVGATNLGVSAGSSTVAITSSTGSNISFPAATTTTAGAMTAADKSKLNGIAAGAEVNVQSDWNASSGDAAILNKPTIPTNNNQLTNGAGYVIASGTVQKANTVALTAEGAINATRYLAFTDQSASGTGALKTSTSLTYNPSTDLLYANIYGTATNATNVAIADAGNSSVSHYVALTAYTNSNQPLKSDVQLRYSPSTNVLTASIDGTAARLATARSIALAGDVTGSATFDGSANISITATVADDSHNHTIANVDGLQTALDGKLSTTATAANSQLLDSLDSTSFIRSDASDTFSGDLTGSGRLKLTNSEATSLSDAALWLSGVTGAILLDDAAQKRISWNDGGGNLNIRSNAYFSTGADRYVQTGGGACDIEFTSDGANGAITFRVAATGTASNAISWARQLVLNNTQFVIDGNNIWHSGNDGSGSNLDADKLDGLEATSFLRSDADTTFNASGNDFIFESDGDRNLFRFQLNGTAKWTLRQSNSGNDLDFVPSNGAANVKINSNKIWHAGNDGASSGLDADLLDAQQGSYYLDYNNFTNTPTIPTNNNQLTNGAGYITGLDFDSLGGKTSATGNYSTNGNLQSGRGSGGVAMTINDGFGNANLTFNHVAGVPEQNGNAFRIQANTDATSNATLWFGGKSNVTGGTALNLNNLFTMSESGATCLGNTVWHAGNDGTGSGLDADTLDGLESTQFARTDVADTFTASATFNGGLVLGAGARISNNNTNSKDKIRVWTNSQYTIGMASPISFGAINSDFAMTFQMNGVASRGFWWGIDSHTNNQGAMSLSTNGKLTIADSIRIGYGTSDTTVPGATYGFDLSGSMYVGGSISATGDVTAYASDARLKENIKPIDSPLDKLQQLSGYTFDWSEKSEELGFTPRHKENDAGLLAQEVQAVLPQAVAPAPFDLNENGESRSGENYLTVQYEKLVPLLVEAIKEQHSLILKLQSEIQELRG